jgi:hypothetical protein
MADKYFEKSHKKRYALSKRLVSRSISSLNEVLDAALQLAQHEANAYHGHLYAELYAAYGKTPAQVYKKIMIDRVAPLKKTLSALCSIAAIAAQDYTNYESRLQKISILYLTRLDKILGVKIDVGEEKEKPHAKKS